MRLTSDQCSVLDFCHFLEAAKLGVDEGHHVLPMERVGFYRKIVQKLIEAGELPARANQGFDAAFGFPSLAAFENRPDLTGR